MNFRIGSLSIILSVFVALFAIEMSIGTILHAHQEELNTAILADNQEETYRRCLIAVNRNPEAALNMARRWGRLSGGNPADHCAALALVGLGDPEEAARHLERLATESSGTIRVRAGLLGQAGRAWMSAGFYDSGLDMLNKAITLYQGDSSFFYDRSLCHAALGNLWPAIDDLNQVLNMETDSIDALVLRGSAYRQLDVDDLASEDISRALRAEPDNVDALLEQGLLEQKLGSFAKARKNWIRILEIAPSSAAGDAVRQRLEQLDISIDSMTESVN